MKKQLPISKKTIHVFMFVLACFLSMQVLHAQNVLPNVKVNSQSYYEISLEGGAKPIAVLNDTVYAVWHGKSTETTGTVYFAKSIDKGLTFSADMPVVPLTASVYYAHPSVAVSQDGTIHVAWVAVTNDFTFYDIWYTKSVDGGNTFQMPVTVTTNHGSTLPCIGVYNNNVYIFYAMATAYPVVDYYFARSTNSGISFNTPIQVNDAACTGYINFEGVTSLTLDYSGNIYLAWVDGRRANGNGDIFFAKSTDDGQTFSANVMVNDVSQAGADSIQYLPSIDANKINDIYVAFADKRLGNNWTNNRVYLAKSSDGGSTFSTEALVAGHNETCKHHDIIVNANDDVDVALNTFVDPHWGVWLYVSDNGGGSFSSPVALCDALDKNYGEIRIVAGPDMEIYALWTDDRAGEVNLYFTRTNFTTGIYETTNDDEYVLFPNPTNGRVFIEIPYDSKDAEINICDMQGQVIYRNAEVKTSMLSLDLEIPNGIYIIKIQSNKGMKTLKLVKN